VLNVGCGTEAITRGIADAVAPGVDNALARISSVRPGCGTSPPRAEAELRAWAVSTVTAHTMYLLAVEGIV
jgi:hypothetical protein